MYADIGTITWPQGTPFEFTFNTWGIAPSPFPRSDPFRHGKAVYYAVATQKAIHAYRTIYGRTKPLVVLEIGSGTGAGASFFVKSNFARFTLLRA